MWTAITAPSEDWDWVRLWPSVCACVRACHLYSPARVYGAVRLDETSEQLSMQFVQWRAFIMYLSCLVLLFLWFTDLRDPVRLLPLAPQSSLGLGLHHKIRLNFLEASRRIILKLI